MTRKKVALETKCIGLDWDLHGRPKQQALQACLMGVLSALLHEAYLMISSVCLLLLGRQEPEHSLSRLPLHGFLKDCLSVPAPPGIHEAGGTSR